jgi:hypothetical protein
MTTRFGALIDDRLEPIDPMTFGVVSIARASAALPP